MAQAMVQDVPVLTHMPRQANCTECLTRNCPMAGSADFPVERCCNFRQANCYLCNKTECVLNGTFDSPVRVCQQFEMLAA